MKKKIKPNSSPTYPTFFSGITSLFHSQLFNLLSTPSDLGRMVNGLLWSVYSSSSPLLLPPHTYPCFSMDPSERLMFLWDKPAPPWALHVYCFFRKYPPAPIQCLRWSTLCISAPACSFISFWGQWFCLEQLLPSFSNLGFQTTFSLHLFVCVCVFFSPTLS